MSNKTAKSIPALLPCRHSAKFQPTHSGFAISAAWSLVCSLTLTLVVALAQVGCQASRSTSAHRMRVSLPTASTNEMNSRAATVKVDSNPRPPNPSHSKPTQKSDSTSKNSNPVSNVGSDSTSGKSEIAQASFQVRQAEAMVDDEIELSGFKISQDMAAEPAVPLGTSYSYKAPFSSGAAFEPLNADSLPIDLPTALALAGGDHLQIELARERIREACARWQEAKVLWVPSLNVGVGYNQHSGPLQAVNGEITDVRRQSLYFGGGPAIGNAPLSGGANGPARFFVDLPLTDVLFEPLVARQRVAVAQHAARRASNDNLLAVAIAYQELIRAHLQIDVANEAVANAAQLVELTTAFQQAGAGLEADRQRAIAELKMRERDASVAVERRKVASAELARLLRMDSTTELIPSEKVPLHIDLSDPELPMEELVTSALSQRPELAQFQAQVAETNQRILQERWRPWLPHLFAGYATAGFGGGAGNDMQDFGLRQDWDVLAVWQVRNMGAGNRALVRQRESQNRQAHLEFEWLRDQVIAEVVQAKTRCQQRLEQIELARLQVDAATAALPLNFNGIRDNVIRPIEAQQALAAVASARSLYVTSVVDYNQAQLELTRALGQLGQQ